MKTDLTPGWVVEATLEQERVSPTLEVVLPDGNKHPPGSPPTPLPLIKSDLDCKMQEKTFIDSLQCLPSRIFSSRLLPRKTNIASEDNSGKVRPHLHQERLDVRNKQSDSILPA